MYFEAFKGARRLPWVQALLSDKLKRIKRLQVSKISIKINAMPSKDLEYTNASLSACGKMCIVTTTPNGKENKLYLYNFSSNRYSILSVPNLEWACVYDKIIFLGIKYETNIFFAPVKKVLTGLPFENFFKFSVPGQIFTAAVDRAASGQIVFLSKPSNKLIVVNLHTHTCNVIHTSGDLDSAGGFTGILIPNMLCVAQPSQNKKTLVGIDMNGRRQNFTMKGLFGNSIVLPSTNNTLNLSYAAILDWLANFFWRGRTGEFKFPVKPYPPSLVRVYQDVFLCLDYNTYEWRALRIAIP
eukprot:gnl/Chilomastix_cuspidata/6901.p1 GENE.gnl/Chilomastix_cuspidata/6901~~gnl/Chilomastix_cuspidata/6901.p1  ORF type:complete len:328 (-),score=3.22 gnl/Chilomastix_cuspidata/6901:227-1120(-)